MNAIAVDTQSIPNAIMDSHCRALLHIVAKFFDEPANQADYLIWHMAKYGCTPEELKLQKAERNA